LALLTKDGILADLVATPSRPISDERLGRVHTVDYIARVQRMANRGGGNLDADTYVGPESEYVARLAAGGLAEMVSAALEGSITNGFALVRPPGHHALPGRGMGFCIYNNIAIAARMALDEFDLERIFIVDFDVHHGNGTQAIFYRDPHVFYFSTHQYPYYPGTGDWRDIGEEEGVGTTCNVPLQAGVGDIGYGRVFDELLWPLAERYQPQLVLVSAGFDAHWMDPLASMQLSIEGYAHLWRSLRALADKLCSGKLIAVLEGGYELDVLAHSVLTTFRILRNPQAAASDPFGPSPWREGDITPVLQQLKGLHQLV